MEFEILRQTAAGNVVMNERIDNFVMKGKESPCPSPACSRSTDGKISFWRDYFDNGMFMKALNG